MKRSLTLRREALSDLSAVDLGGVVGGRQYTGTATARMSCGLDDCRNDIQTILTAGCQPTVDINRCPTLLC